MAIVTESQLGVLAHKAGEPITANPFPRNSEEAGAWADGWRSQIPARTASVKEVAEAAQLTDVSRFRRKSNRYYR